MGGCAGEFIKNLNAGIICPRTDLVHIAGVPAQGSVKRAPKTFPGQIGLAAAALFPGAAVKNDRARPAAALKIAFYRRGRSQGAGAKEVMAAAMPATAGRQRLFMGQSRFLAQARERVIFAEDADKRPAAPKGAAESRIYPAQPFCHRKPELPQRSAVKRRRLMLFQGQLRIFPDFIRQFFIEFRHGVHRLYGGLFQLVHCALHYSTLDRKSFSLGCWGYLNISSGLPSSRSLPSAMKSTRLPTSRAKPISWVTTAMVMPS